jgi:hypothetical protein
LTRILFGRWESDEDLLTPMLMRETLTGPLMRFHARYTSDIKSKVVQVQQDPTP